MKLWRFLLLNLCTPAILLSPNSYAIGGRIHAEVGLHCAVDYLASEENRLPGLGSLFQSRRNVDILYRACVFPDWGYGGIAQDDGEASHWYRFMRAWADVLRDRGERTPLTPEAQEEIAFFLGAVCHNIADIPWHFSAPGHASFLAQSDQIDHANHTDTEIGSDIIRYTRDPGEHVRHLYNYAPCDTIMAAMQQAGISAERRKVEFGMKREHLVLWGGVVAGWLAADRYRTVIPWSVAHIEDYYYGGIRHNAAACAVWARYWYAYILGGACLQQMPDYFRPDNKDYQPYLGVTDCTLLEDTPANNTGQEALLELGGAPGARRSVLIRFDLADLPADQPVKKATLWLALAQPLADCAATLTAQPMLIPWREGTGQSDPYNGIAGRPATPGEAAWTNSPDENTTTANASQTTVPANSPANTWVELDVTAAVQNWLQNPAANHGLRLKWGQSPIISHDPADVRAPAAQSAPVILRFFSSQAFQADSSGYCGGIRVAYRPMLVILP